MKCKNCKYNEDKFCKYFKQYIKVKKSCWAFEDKINNAIMSSFKFLEGRCR